jgi:phosphatidylglycerophosphate synthase
MLLPIFARDLLVAALREFVLAQGTTQGARLSGKIKAIVQGIVQIGIVVIALLAGVSALTMQVFTLLMWAAVLVTVYSLVDYLIGILRPQA